MIVAYDINLLPIWNQSIERINHCFIKSIWNPYYQKVLRGDECCARARIWFGRRVWRRKFLWSTWTNFTSMQRQSHGYIPYTFFWVAFLFPIVSIIQWTLQFAYRNILSRFFNFNLYNWQSNQPWHIDRMFSQTVYAMKKLIISISINVLNIAFNFK